MEGKRIVVEEPAATIFADTRPGKSRKVREIQCRSHNIASPQAKMDAFDVPFHQIDVRGIVTPKTAVHPQTLGSSPARSLQKSEDVVRVSWLLGHGGVYGLGGTGALRNPHSLEGGSRCGFHSTIGRDFARWRPLKRVVVITLPTTGTVTVPPAVRGIQDTWGEEVSVGCL